MKADEVLDQPKESRMRLLVSQFLKIFKMSYYYNPDLSSKNLKECQERIFKFQSRLQTDHLYQICSVLIQTFEYMSSPMSHRRSFVRKNFKILHYRQMH